MNLIDAEVTKIISPIREEVYEWGTIFIAEVEFCDDGGRNTKDLVFYKKEEADKLKVGYVFQH
jgi:hypothetical protein